MGSAYDALFTFRAPFLVGQERREFFWHPLSSLLVMRMIR
jgi:hypothetical protein